MTEHYYAPALQPAPPAPEPEPASTRPWWSRSIRPYADDGYLVEW